MLEIRLFEEKVQELFMEGLIQGTTHLCQGQEAVSVGAVAALRERRLPDDHLSRPRPRARARHVDGGVLRRADGAHDRLLRAASAARCTSPTSSRGLLGAFAIVGAGLPVAVGAALLGEAAGHGPRRDHVLRRRRDEHRHVPRGAEHGGGLEGRRSSS